MDWVTNIHEPFFQNREKAEKYVAQELELAVPEGWRISQSRDQPLTWIIEKEKLEPQEWPNQDYCVRVSNGLDLVIFTYGNTDVGPFQLQHVLHSALVIEAVMLRAFSLSDCLRFLFTHQKPNESGYT